MDNSYGNNMSFSMYNTSRRSSSKGMKMDIDSCTVICATIILLTLVLIYHVHHVCVKEAELGNTVTANRMCNVRTGLLLLLALEAASLFMHMRK